MDADSRFKTQAEPVPLNRPRRIRRLARCCDSLCCDSFQMIPNVLVYLMYMDAVLFFKRAPMYKLRVPLTRPVMAWCWQYQIDRYKQYALAD